MKRSSNRNHSSVAGLRSVRRPAFGRWRVVLSAVACLAGAIGVVSHIDPAGSNDPEARKEQMTSSSAAGRKIQHNRTRREALLDKALAPIRDEPDQDRRQQLLTTFLDQHTTGEIRDLLNDLQGASDRDFVNEATTAWLRRWAETEAPAAAIWATSQPPGPLKDSAVGAVATVWANVELTGASQWAEHLSDQRDRDAAIPAVANEAVRTDPQEALRLAQELPENPEQKELLRHAAMEWAANDAIAAVAWARQIPDTPARDQVLAAVATSWSAQDPLAAATLAAAEITPGDDQDRAIAGIVQRWAQLEPEKVSSWIEQFPEGELRKTVSAYLAALKKTGEEK